MIDGVEETDEDNPNIRKAADTTFVKDLINYLEGGTEAVSNIVKIRKRDTSDTSNGHIIIKSRPLKVTMRDTDVT